jgi:prepilin-type N-terminal cleavage/methylation domain-containing protein
MDGYRKRAFTLVEVLIAVLVITISSLGLYSATLSAKRIMYAGRVRLEAQRFSYDLAYKILHMSVTNQANFVNKLSPFVGDINAGYKWYDAPSGTMTTNDQVDFSVDLRKLAGFVNVNHSLFLDGRGVKVEVVVSWANSAGHTLSYTTTIYRHIGN